MMTADANRSWRDQGGARPIDALINIDVPNLEEAIRFYEKGLGLRLGRRLFGGEVAEMLGVSSPIYLLTKDEGSAPIPQAAHTRSYKRHWTPVHLDFVVEDLEAAIDQAEKAGAIVEMAPEGFPWGRLATLSDPFGHGFCLLQWSGRGYANDNGSATLLGT
jgi:predicted enzyme related to lactoylglutathione lyase